MSILESYQSSPIQGLEQRLRDIHEQRRQAAEHLSSLIAEEAALVTALGGPFPEADQLVADMQVPLQRTLTAVAV